MKTQTVLDEQDRYILRRIKRQFKKDEAVLFLTNTISKLEQEIGVLKSEKEELIFAAKTKQVQNPVPKIATPKQQPFAKTIKCLEETIFKVSTENQNLKAQLASQLKTTI